MRKFFENFDLMKMFKKETVVEESPEQVKQEEKVDTIKSVDVKLTGEYELKVETNGYVHDTNKRHEVSLKFLGLANFHYSGIDYSIEINERKVLLLTHSEDRCYEHFFNKIANREDAIMKEVQTLGEKGLVRHFNEVEFANKKELFQKISKGEVNIEFKLNTYKIKK